MYDVCVAAKPPLPSTQSSTRNASTRELTRRRSCTASTSPSARRDPQWLSWWRGWLMLTPWSIPSWCLPLPLMLLPCSTWLPTPAAPWASTSETTESTPWSSMTICPSRWVGGDFKQRNPVVKVNFEIKLNLMWYLSAGRRLPSDVPAAPSSPRPRGLPRRRLLLAFPSAGESC